MVPAVSSSNEVRSINQLQDNIRFLQTKHQIMLTRLHDEVDLLRQKNRGKGLKPKLYVLDTATSIHDMIFIFRFAISIGLFKNNTSE